MPAGLSVPAKFAMNWAFLCLQLSSYVLQQFSAYWDL
jgi:hypothetical protein